MIGDRKSFEKMEDYKGAQVVVTTNKEIRRSSKKIEDYKDAWVVVTANNLKLPIKHINKAMVVPQFNSTEVKLEKVLHVPRMKKKLLLVSQLISKCNYMVLGPDNMKVYR